MRLLLVHPPLSANREVTPPLGLCTLAAGLKRRGHLVRILDLDLEIKGLPNGAGLYLQRFEYALHDFAPEAVGITSMYSNSLQAERIIMAVKAFDPSIVTIAGGSHFGALGLQALQRLPELDYAVEGEGEEAFSALLEALEHGVTVAEIPRLHYRVDGTVLGNPSKALIDLSALPPVWSELGDVIDLKRYADTVPADSQRRTIYIEAGRGCPFACTFCATAPFWERKYRVKSIESIIEEMRFLFENYGYNGFMLVHDLLTADKRFINAFSEAMIESRLPVEWMANHRTDIDLHGILPKMKTAGCWAMFFGTESASARLQKEMRKGLKREETISTIRALSDLGIASTCSFVMGFPDESPEELSATIAMGAELKIMGAGLLQFHRLRTWPPSPLSRKNLPAEFDIDSLRIEYPFLVVPPQDTTIIEGDREFFAGYFAPISQAGTFAQLAQAELFFTQAVAAAPLTIAVLGRLLGPNFLENFYDVLTRRGGVTRDEIEANSSSMLALWSVVKPFLQEWASQRRISCEWSRELLRSVMAYEQRRLRFVEGEANADDDMDASGENWGAFVSNADIAAVFDAIISGGELTSEFVRRSAIVFVRLGVNSFRAYTMDVDRIEELRGHTLLVQPQTRSNQINEQFARNPMEAQFKPPPPRLNA